MVGVWASHQPVPELGWAKSHPLLTELREDSRSGTLQEPDTHYVMLAPTPPQAQEADVVAGAHTESLHDIVLGSSGILTNISFPCASTIPSPPPRGQQLPPAMTKSQRVGFESYTGLSTATAEPRFTKGKALAVSSRN